MINAIQHLDRAAAAYRSMTAPDANAISEQMAKKNVELAEEFERAAEALRKVIQHL